MRWPCDNTFVRDLGWLGARVDPLPVRAPELLALDDATFRSVFAGSPIKRIGRDRFLRNVLYAVGNSDDASLIAPTKALLDDPSPLVRGAAVWALSQLTPAGMKPDPFAELTRLREANAQLRRLSARAGLDPADLIAEVVREIGLDVEVALRPGPSAVSARRHLDAFQDAARGFAAELTARLW